MAKKFFNKARPVSLADFASSIQRKNHELPELAYTAIKTWNVICTKVYFKAR